MPVARHL